MDEKHENMHVGMVVVCCKGKPCMCVYVELVLCSVLLIVVMYREHGKFMESSGVVVMAYLAVHGV